MRKVLLMLILSMALVAGLVVVRSRQELRRGATAAMVDVMFLPNSREIAVGEQFASTVLVDTKEERFLGMDILIRFDSSKLKAVSVENGTDSTVSRYFNEDNLVYSAINQGEGIIALACAASEKDMNMLPRGVSHLFKINFEAIGDGQAEVGLDADYEHIFVGQKGDTVGVLPLGNGTEAIYTVTGGGGDDSVLNFWVTFSGLRADAGDCVGGWKSKLMVLGGGETKVYESVELVRDGVKVVEIDGHDVELARYRGSVRLNGFDQKEGVAVFFKGPMHVQVKYGVGGQSSWYKKAGGELSLTSDFDTSPVYDFTGYSVLAGDVTGEFDGVPDGVLNGQDFSYVKSKISISKEVLSGGEMVMGDFDGDCWVGNVDLAILLLSLQEKQSHLY